MDHDLFDRARRGDADALDDLLVTQGERVRHTVSINAKWRSMLEVDDVMQVAYLEAILDFEKSGVTADRFAAWFKTIVHNNLKDAIKRLDALKRPSPDDRITSGPNGEDPVEQLFLEATASCTPSRSYAKQEMIALLEAELERLPEIYGDVLRLMYIQQQSPAETAATLGATVGAVYLRRLRGVARLRDLFSASAYSL